MRAIIDLNEENLASIEFLEEGKEDVKWKDFTKEEQEAFVNALNSFTRLFGNCIKE